MLDVARVIALVIENFFTWLAQMFGISTSGGQIVKVIPSRAAQLRVTGRQMAKASVQANSEAGHIDATKLLPPKATQNGHGQQHSEDDDAMQESLGNFILSRCPSLKGTYKPAWWLPNGHFQTMYCVVGNFNEIDKITYSRTLLRVRDGGTIGVDISPPHHRELPPDAPTIIVAHGLTGGSYESYVRNILEWVVRPKSEGGLGGRGVVANYRGCAGTELTSQQAYSAMYTGDYDTVVSYIANQFPRSPRIGVGFSLGGSVLSRYLGEHGQQSLLVAGVSIGCPWDVPAMSEELNTGFLSSRIYSSAMGHNLTKMLGKHLAPEHFCDKHEQASRSSPTDSGTSTPPIDLTHPWGDLTPELLRLKKKGRHLRMKEFDDLITSKVGGLRKEHGGCFPFDGADDYYAHASSKNFIKDVKRPLLGINSFDDPVIHGSALPIDEVTNSSHVLLAVTARGGHLGWFDGPLFARKDRKTSRPRLPQQRWVVKPVSEFIAAVVSELDSGGTFGPDAPVGEHVGFKAGDDGWVWRKNSEDDLYGPIGWKVEGKGEEVQGKGHSGVLAGL